MNEMSELERQWLSWTPRRPSARLERRLFAGGGPVATEAVLPFRFSWLAPATAALMLMCVVFNQRHGGALTSSAGPYPLVATILSNQSAAAYLPGSVQAERNNLPANAFEWASARGMSAPRPSASPARGNH